MSDSSEVVIIGGGVMGCSIQHGLAEKGVTNSLLLEQNELASGSTSRSQAILRMHYSNEVTARLAWESLKIFKEFKGVSLDQFLFGIFWFFCFRKILSG